MPPLQFVRDVHVQPMVPYRSQDPRMDRPEHSILLELRSHSGKVTQGRLEVERPVSIATDTLAALRPEEARQLARLLSEAAGSHEPGGREGEILPFLGTPDT